MATKTKSKAKTRGRRQLTAEQKIKAAMSFNLKPVIERYIRDFEVSAGVAREHERELRRYLAMCGINPRKRYGMRGPIDDLWHTFLIFTSTYMDFCTRLGGFIHHKPEKRGAPTSKTAYLNTLSDYKKYFGEDPPAHVWPTGAKVALDCSSSCNSCGGGCSGCAGGCTGCTACGSDCSP